MSCRVGGAMSSVVRMSEQSTSWALMASLESSLDWSTTSFLFLRPFFLSEEAENNNQDVIK